MVPLSGMSESSNLKNEQIRNLLDNPLHLPDGESFVSATPRVPVQQMIALSEKLLPLVNSQPDFIETRKRLAIDEPFVL
jgi:hypothetical protein